MTTGAIIVAVDFSGQGERISPMLPAGTISVAQRMIASFQRAGVSCVAVITDSDSKKLWKHLSQKGVIFLKAEPDQTKNIFQCIGVGLEYMQKNFDRVLVAPGNIPLFLPKTVEELLASNKEIAIPTYENQNGYPVLLSGNGISEILNIQDAASLESAIFQCTASKEYISVDDSGILKQTKPLKNCKKRIVMHNRQLTRPVLGVSLNHGKPFFDSRIVTLLHLVDETHSVRLACDLVQISYSTACNMLNNAENELGYSLIARTRGGSVGSKSILTEKGRKLMNTYDQFEADLKQNVEILYDKYFFDMF